MKLNYHSVDSGNCTYFFKEQEASYILPRICMIPAECGKKWSIHSCTSDGEPCSPYTNQDKIEFVDIEKLFSDTINRDTTSIEIVAITSCVAFYTTCKECGKESIVNWRGEIAEECSCSSK